MTRDQMLVLLAAPNLEQRLPEVARLRGVPQPPEFHTEGDVLVHTRLVVAALPQEAGQALVWAAALHDIGKADTTGFVDGRWRAHGHDLRSAQLVPQVLRRFDAEADCADVVWLVRHHLFACSWQPASRKGLTSRQLRFCQHPLFDQLVQLCRADALGSHGHSKKIDHLQLILDQLAQRKSRTDEDSSV